MEQANSSIRVEIYDQTYHLRGSDREYVQRLAEYVDGKMRQVAAQTSTVDSLRLAVLAALNIADELQLIRGKYDNVATEYTQRASHLQSALDSALDEVLADARKAG
ncbi:MAG: cell division protein ZapA [Terriglobia bacterium]|nr:cell division protein ZapA [Terriglobia bacterium]